MAVRVRLKKLGSPLEIQQMLLEVSQITVGQKILKIAGKKTRE